MVTSVEAIESISQEDQRGDLIAAIHSERLLSLTAVLEGALFTREPSLDQSSRLVAAASRLLDSGCLSAFDSIKVALTSGFHRHLISALHFVVTIMGQPSLSQSTLSLPSVSAISRTLETSIRLSILNLRYLLTCPFTEGESLDTLIQDVSTVTSLFQAIIKSPYSPPASTWLAYCLEGDLFRLQLSILSSLSLPFTQEPSKVLTVTQSILGLFLAMASFPPAAERLATEGFLHAITTSPIASLAEEGTIKSQSLERPSERDPMHSVWCSITAIIAQLSMFLSHSSSFVAETIGYAQLFHAQLKKPLGWNSTDSLTLSDIDEMQATIALVAFLARRAPESEATRMLQDDIWTLVNTLVYCIQHPNTLLSTLEPIAFRERQWLDKAIREPSKTDAIGFGQRPSTGALIQVFLK